MTPHTEMHLLETALRVVVRVRMVFFNLAKRTATLENRIMGHMVCLTRISSAEMKDRRRNAQPIPFRQEKK
jgi:hypothetical protein